MKTRLGYLLVVAIMAFGYNAGAQIKIDLKKKINNQINRRVNDHVDKAIDKSLDNVENGVKDAAKKDDGNNQNQQNQQDQQKKPQDQQNKQQGGTAGDQVNQPQKQEQPQFQSFSKYDFVPGDNILLFEDFSQDAVGDFPALWTTDVAGEINTLSIGPGNWFNLNSGEGTYWFMKDIDFPRNFIVELDIVPKKDGRRIAADLVLYGEDKHSEMDKDVNPGVCGIHIQMEKANWITRGYKKGSNEYLSGSSAINPVEEEKLNHVILWVQNRRLRIYHKGAKVLDIPTNIYEGCQFKRLCFKLYRGASCGSYISNVKITSAAPDTRSKLLTEGKLVSYGIYFDVNKDVVKPESYGALKDIAGVLNENAELKVKIVGHTDSDGADAANLDLSKRRAAAVKAELVKSFAVSGERLVTDGLGESQPVAPNDIPVNKAKNRRVEFIRQ